MTALGKILVVVQLVFSLVVGAFILMDFAVRTNWQAGYERLRKNYEVSQAYVRTSAEEAKDTKIKADDAIKKKDDENEKLKKENKEAKDLIAKKDEEIEKKALDSRLVGVNSETIVTENRRLKEELKKADEKIKTRDDKLVEEGKKRREDLDKYTRLDIAFKSQNHRLQKQNEQIEALSKQVDTYKSGGSIVSGISGSTQAPKPPPEDVQGIVTEVSPQDGLISISIGSDAGIGKGNTLSVYRLAPKPQYLGELRIIDANHHEAVGRLVSKSGQRATLIQKGDRVASRIME